MKIYKKTIRKLLSENFEEITPEKNINVARKKVNENKAKNMKFCWRKVLMRYTRNKYEKFSGKQKLCRKKTFNGNTHKKKI